MDTNGFGSDAFPTDDHDPVRQRSSTIFISCNFYWFGKDREKNGSGFSHDLKIKPKKLKIFLNDRHLPQPMIVYA